MHDFLDILVQNAKETISSGYYTIPNPSKNFPLSLKNAIIKNSKNAIISEVKAVSPSRGIIRKNFLPEKIAEEMEKGGATGISILTEPKKFQGSINYFEQIRKKVNIPTLMKDIIIDPIQLKTASKIGADVILLIHSIYERKYSEYTLNEMISIAHEKNLEVLLETHNEKEFKIAIKSKADLVGINNRDLKSLKVDLGVTERILKRHRNHNKIVISESGVMNKKDLLFLRNCGAHAFLIGSSIMMAKNITKKVKEFVNAS